MESFKKWFWLVILSGRVFGRGSIPKSMWGLEV